MNGLSAFLTAQVIGFLLVFARFGAVTMFLPGFGEQSVPVRTRLAFALVLSAGLLPATPLRDVPAYDTLVLVRLLATEVTIGLWIGLTARILFSALQFAGYQIGMVAGLSNAFAPSIGSFEGSTLIGGAMLMAGTALIFATDLHHVMLGALLLSYDVFPVGLMMAGDLTQQILTAASKSIYIGVAISSPFYILGLLLNLGLGLANRMMPSLPVFFIAGPVLIVAGLLVLAVSGPSVLHSFLGPMADWLQTLSF